jgi:hypothetical protein
MAEGWVLLRSTKISPIGEEDRMTCPPSLSGKGAIVQEKIKIK